MTTGGDRDPFDDETAAENEAQRTGAGHEEEFEDETTEKEIVVPPGELVPPGEVVPPPAEKIAGADEERFRDGG